MSKSSSGGLFGRQHTGSVTLVEQPVRITYQRKARLTFWVVGITVGALAATVASHYWHPIVGLFAGAAIGALVGFLTALVVLAWPVLRAFWWWADAIVTGAFVVYGWTALMSASNLIVSLLAVAVLVGVPAAVPAIRRPVVAFIWCAIVRHRLRYAFSRMVRSGGQGRPGSLPFIFLAKPTPAGERVWIWVRPGLSLTDLEGQLGSLAETCGASEVRVARASRSYAAFVRVDIARRDPLRDLVFNPLASVGDGFDSADIPVSPGMPPVGLDLPDVPEPPGDERPTGGRTPRPRTNGTGPATNGRKPDDPNDAFI